MPRKPPTPCSYPRCPRLTHGRYCDEHAKLAEHNYRKYERDPEIDRRYGRQWRRIRARYVADRCVQFPTRTASATQSKAEHPLCEQCQKEGRLTPTQEVHHILPPSRGGTHDFDHLMALCKPCHSRISALDGDRWHSKHMYKTQLFPK